MKNQFFGVRSSQNNHEISDQSGFTIVELLVVIVVIGILAAITIVSYTGISQKAVVASIQSDLSAASQQLKIYQAINGAYPTSLDANNCFLPATSDNNCLKGSMGNTFASFNATSSAFCLTVTNGSNLYNVTSDSGAQTGGCYGGIDNYAKLMLHTDGANNSTIFTDSEPTPKTATVSGGAKIDTATSEFGGASAIFPTASDYVSFADSNDWNMGTGNFTIDFWMNMSTMAQNQNIFAQKVGADNSNIVFSYWDAASKSMIFRIYSGGVTLADLTQPTDNTWATGTWYHIAIVRNGNVWTLYKNGTSIATQTVSATYPDYAAPLTFGYGILGGFAGHLDEFRVSKGIARWTSNFTPPTQAYSY